MELSHQDVISIYEKLKLKAFSFYRKGNYLQSLKHIISASKWAYRFNFIYVDEELERLLKDIANCTLSVVNVSRNTDRFVLLETHGMDNRGLTQQYIRAFMSMGVEFLYVSVQCMRSKCPDILKELEAYDRAIVLLFDSEDLDDIKKSSRILSEIENYQPSRVFLHLMPWDVVSLMVTHAIKGAIKYNINLTDHAFWLGASFIDYNLEFSAYGKTISLEKRNLQEDQLLYSPYYPILPKDKTSFQGYPEQAKDKLVLFTGGSFYKMFGKDDLFFLIMDALLDLSDNLILLIAGGGDFRLMKKKISQLKNQERILLIGNRKDISEVFKSCDIYLDTYPIAGGLMEQYASFYGKPILAYSDWKKQLIKDQGVLLRSAGNGVCSYDDLDEFLRYADKLINDVAFRTKEGRKNIQLVPSVHKFNECFKLLLSKHFNDLAWKNISIDYEEIKNLYLNVENRYANVAIKELLKVFKLNAFLYFPKYSVHFIHCVVRKFLL